MEIPRTKATCSTESQSDRHVSSHTRRPKSVLKDYHDMYQNCCVELYALVAPPPWCSGTGVRFGPMRSSTQTQLRRQWRWSSYQATRLNAHCFPNSHDATNMSYVMWTMFCITSLLMISLEQTCMHTTCICVGLLKYQSHYGVHNHQHRFGMFCWGILWRNIHEKNHCVCLVQQGYSRRHETSTVTCKDTVQSCICDGMYSCVEDPQSDVTDWRIRWWRKKWSITVLVNIPNTIILRIVTIELFRVNNKLPWNRSEATNHINTSKKWTHWTLTSLARILLITYLFLCSPTQTTMWFASIVYVRIVRFLEVNCMFWLCWCGCLVCSRDKCSCNDNDAAHAHWHLAARPVGIGCDMHEQI